MLMRSGALWERSLIMDKNEAKAILDKSKASCAIKETIITYEGADNANAVWERAAEMLADTMNHYPPFPDKEYRHVKGIFNASVLYLSLKEYNPAGALTIIEEGMASHAKKTARTYQRMVKIPFGRTIFLKGFAMGTKGMFGETAGFKQDFHNADCNEIRFDVLKCPYVRYTTELGCPEIAHIFCDNDMYAYGSLKGITFERTQTLGTGGEKCDFHLYKSAHEE